jgi:hypothetical protein
VPRRAKRCRHFSMGQSGSQRSQPRFRQPARGNPGMGKRPSHLWIPTSIARALPKMAGWNGRAARRRPHGVAAGRRCWGHQDQPQSGQGRGSRAQPLQPPLRQPKLLQPYPPGAGVSGPSSAGAGVGSAAGCCLFCRGRPSGGGEKRRTKGQNHQPVLELALKPVDGRTGDPAPGLDQ